MKTAKALEISDYKEKNITKILDMAVRVIRKHIGRDDYKIILFGSWANLKAVPTSDIDIAVSGRAGVDYITMAKIKEEIDNLPTLRKIDVVDLSAVDEGFRKAVLREGEVLD
jgi:predicted nucleotidyltransferase